MSGDTGFDEFGRRVDLPPKPSDARSAFEAMLMEFEGALTGQERNEHGEVVPVPRGLYPFRASTPMEREAFGQEERARVEKRSEFDAMIADDPPAGREDRRQAFHERRALGPPKERPAPDETFSLPFLGRFPGEPAGPIGATVAAATGANRVGPEALGVFAGRRAQNAPPGRQASRGEALMTRDFEGVRRRTGWFQGADGEMRFEIDDSQATLTLGQRGSSYRLGEAFDHPELYRQYPELSDLPVHFVVREFGDIAEIRDDGIYLNVRHNRDDLRKAALHEIQHAIQDIEGFSPGSSPELEMWRRLDLENNPAEALRNRGAGPTRSDFRAYQTRLGEIEGRDVERRADMTPEQRRANQPVQYLEPGGRPLRPADEISGARASRTEPPLPGFYSPAIRAVERTDMKSGTPQQWLNRMKRQDGFTPQELNEAGWKEFTRGRENERIPRDEVLGFLQEKQGGRFDIGENVNLPLQFEAKIITESRRERSRQSFFRRDKWAPHTIISARDINGEFRRFRVFDPGPDTGREYLIANMDGVSAMSAPTLEGARHMIIGALSRGRRYDQGQRTLYHQKVIPGGENYRETLVRAPKDLENWSSPHFRDQEIVHIRHDDRTGPNGERVFAVNEIQSDVHQRGRKTGYATIDEKRRAEEFNSEVGQVQLDALNGKITYEESNRLKEDLLVKHGFNRNEKERVFKIIEEGAVPPGPFQGDKWTELAIKQAIKMAVDEGYDAVAFPTAKQIAPHVGYNAERLSQHYDRKVAGFAHKYAKRMGGRFEMGDIGFSGSKRPEAASTPSYLIRITPEMRRNVQTGQSLYAAGPGAFPALEALGYDQEERP